MISHTDEVGISTSFNHRFYKRDSRKIKGGVGLRKCEGDRKKEVNVQMHVIGISGEAHGDPRGLTDTGRRNRHPADARLFKNIPRS